MNIKKRNKDLFFNQFLSPQALDFIENSKCTYANMWDLGIHARSVMLTPYYMQQIFSSTTELGCTKKIKLSLSSQSQDINTLRDLQIKRKSIRRYSKLLNIEELSDMLLNSYFVVETNNQGNRLRHRRSIPSGGGVFPIDLYVINLNTEGLAQGLYFFNPHSESLETLKEYKSYNDIFSDIKAIFPQDMLGDWDFSSISAIVVYAGIINRVSCKYFDRGLRFALMDVGAIMQNVHLSCAALDLDCCAIGGYIDDEANKLLNLSYPNECVFLLHFIGKN